jgi:amino acid transporter
MNANAPSSHLPLLYMIGGFLVLYTLYVVSLFRPRKSGRRRHWRTHDWLWVPLAGLTGVVLLALWWHLRIGP